MIYLLYLQIRNLKMNKIILNLDIKKGVPKILIKK